jgi:hypothetical protein
VGGSHGNGGIRYKTFYYKLEMIGITTENGWCVNVTPITTRRLTFWWVSIIFTHQRTSLSSTIKDGREAL